MFVFTISTVVEIAVFVILAIWYVTIKAKDYLKQKRCKHEEYYENRSCDATCKSCGKNLGFIGTLRDVRKHDKESTS